MPPISLPVESALEPAKNSNNFGDTPDIFECKQGIENTYHYPFECPSFYSSETENNSSS